MKNLAFVGNGEPPAKLLEIFRKQTPGSKGIWGQLRGVDNYREADYFAVIDCLPGNVQIPESKCVFLGAHPETMHAYRDMSNYKGIAMLDCKHTVGFLEWWIKRDYDFLNALQPPTKTQVLGAIVSDANSQNYHTKRRSWLERFCSTNPEQFNLYGRIKPWNNLTKYYKGSCGSTDSRGAAVTGGNDHMSGKEDVYLNHKYMIEFDATGANYFSERILDCMLLWAMPIYWGGSGVHKYLPENSFRYLNIDGNGVDAVAIAKSSFYEDHIADLTRARHILLNELQLWPRIHSSIFGSFV